MFDLSIFNIAGAMARHAAARQGIVAENIAHADTPGYRARDLQKFDEVMSGEMRPFAPTATRDGHFGVKSGAEFRADEISAFGSEQPNGNTVTLEDQMVRGAETQMQHDMALSIYSTSMDILRTSLGRRA